MLGLGFRWKIIGSSEKMKERQTVAFIIIDTMLQTNKCVCVLPYNRSINHQEVIIQLSRVQLKMIIGLKYF